MGDCKNKKTLRETLGSLIKIKNVKDADVAKYTKIPQATIHHILAGKTINPRIDTTLKLAQYFNVSIEYLLGLTTTLTESRISAFKNVILLEWDMISNWIRGKNLTTILASASDFITSTKVNSKAFALKIKTNSYSTVFKKEAIIIINTDDNFKDSDYVVVSINNHSPTIRRIRKESGQYYLEAITLNILPALLHKEDKVFGKIVEHRAYF